MNLKELLQSKPKKKINYTDLLNCDEWFVKRNIILERDKNKCKICQTEKSLGPIYSGNSKFYFREVKGEIKGEQEKIYLQVHHKFYIIGKLPWEYDNSDLITVCNICHQNIHTTEEISVYDKTKTKKYKLESCDRCGGSGFISEYQHVENGICFKCRGIGSRLPIFEI